MTTLAVTGRIPTKHVTVKGIDGHTDEAILDFALDAAGETRANLFGWRVNRGTVIATVDLYTD